MADLVWAQIKYEHQIPDASHKKMVKKMEEMNEGHNTRTVTLYHILHGDKRDKPQGLPYARQLPLNFAAANKILILPSWYSSFVEGDLDEDFPNPEDMCTSNTAEEPEDDPNIHYMLAIRNGFTKSASCHDVKYLKLLHDLILKVEAITKQALEEQFRPISEDDSDEDDQHQISGIFTQKAIAPLRHVLFEFMHYNWKYKKMELYSIDHLSECWTQVKAKSAPHHAYILMQKLEEAAGLDPQKRLTISAGSGKRVENEPFATPNIIHPLPHLVESPRCKISYFVELWQVTDLATDYIRNWKSSPSNFTDKINFLDRLSDVWFQDLSLLYEKNSRLYQDPKKQVASQIASIEAIRAQAPKFCSLAVLPRWHGIPYLYAQLKHKWGITDEEAEDLDGHLHVAYDEILTQLNGEDLEMDDFDD